MEDSRTAWSGLKENLRQGMRCALFRPVSLQRLALGGEQLALLAAVVLLLSMAASWVTAHPHPEFSPWGFPVFAFGVALTLFAALPLVHLLGRRDRLMPLLVLLFATSPAIVIAGYLARAGLVYGWLGVEGELLSWLPGLLLIGWVLAIDFRVLCLMAEGCGMRPAAGVMVLSVLTLPSMYFSESGEFWYPAEEYAEDPTWAAYEALNAEDMLYAQPALLQTTLQGLRPGTPGKTDVYFVGFAGYARENVFRNEVAFAQRLFEQRFGARGRALSLVNHLDTFQTVPLATGNNLRIALQHLGDLMDDEDMLVLFLTSHGSSDHEIATDFWPLPLNDLSPAMLRQYLDQAHIPWRAVMVSSCYSGGFVEPLRDPRTLVATAAAADRTSFGCGQFRDLTYFGEALLRDALDRGLPLLPAMQSAMNAIQQRERAERLPPSQPQLFVGEAMKAKLEHIEQAQDTACTEAALGC